MWMQVDYFRRLCDEISVQYVGDCFSGATFGIVHRNKEIGDIQPNAVE